MSQFQRSVRRTASEPFVAKMPVAVPIADQVGRTSASEAWPTAYSGRSSAPTLLPRVCRTRRAIIPERPARRGEPALVVRAPWADPPGIDRGLNPLPLACRER